MSPFSSWLESKIKERAGWEQVDLARKMKVNPSLVSKWLHDEVKPNRRMATKLCIVFKVPADYLLPLIDYKDVIEMTEPQDRNEKRAELLARLPALARLLEAILELPIEKQSVYLDLAMDLLPGLARTKPEAE